jgi:hypothetical protein
MSWSSLGWIIIGKPLKLDFQTAVNTRSLHSNSFKDVVLYSRIMEKTAFLSDYQRFVPISGTLIDVLRPRDQVRK